MKVSKKELRRQEAEKKNAPIHLLLIINNMCTQILYGLDGGKVVEGVKVPELKLPKGQKTWCEKQLAKVVRWTAVNLERHGFDFGKKSSAGLWESGMEKVRLIGKAISHYAPQAEYQDACIIQLIVAELAWHNVCLHYGDEAKEANWLKQTLATFTDKFTDGDDFIAEAATDVYMAVDDILDGTTAVYNRDFTA